MKLGMIEKLWYYIRGFRGRNTVLYFAPHQDDELLSMGVDICMVLAKHKNVHIILCSDGSKSGVIRALNNQKKCQYHDGIHHYVLSEKQFVAARDAEFIDSCLALGVKQENIHILPQRAVDRELHKEFAEVVIQSFLERFGYGATVGTIYYDTGEEQHPDHKALGLAVHNLKQRGIVRKARFFKETYCKGNGRAEFSRKKVTSACQDRIKKAIDAYSLWKPEAGRYAVGYHSMAKTFDELRDRMEAYYLKE